ncbi:MAG: SdpI family protein [Bacteroidota bacterium]
MKKHNWLTDNWLLIALIVFSVLLAGIGYTLLPDTVPVHFNHKMEVDRMGSRGEALFGLLMMSFAMIVVNGIIWIAPKIDPKNNFYKFDKTMQKWQYIITAFILGLQILILLSMMGVAVPTARWMLIAMYLLFLLLGNSFGKLRPNYFAGIRIPWTLESEDNWNKTHRMAGRLWVLTSMVMIVISLILPESWLVFFFLPYFLLIVGLPIAYSYNLYREMNIANE